MYVTFNLKLVTAKALFQDTFITSLLENVSCLCMEDVEEMEIDFMMSVAVKMLVFHQVNKIILIHFNVWSFILNRTNN